MDSETKHLLPFAMCTVPGNCWSYFKHLPTFRRFIFFFLFYKSRTGYFRLVCFMERECVGARPHTQPCEFFDDKDNPACGRRRKTTREGSKSYARYRWRRMKQIRNTQLPWLRQFVRFMVSLVVDSRCVLYDAFVAGNFACHRSKTNGGVGRGPH